MPGGFERLGEAGKGLSDGSMDRIKGLGLNPCLSSKSTRAQRNSWKKKRPTA